MFLPTEPFHQAHTVCLVCGCTAARCVCGGQSTAYRSWFSSSILWVAEVKIRLLSLVVSTFACWAISLAEPLSLETGLIFLVWLCTHNVGKMILELLILQSLQTGFWNYRHTSSCLAASSLNKQTKTQLFLLYLYVCVYAQVISLSSLCLYSWSHLSGPSSFLQLIIIHQHFTVCLFAPPWMGSVNCIPGKVVHGCLNPAFHSLEWHWNC